MVRSECCGETDIWQIKVSSQVPFEDIELDWGILKIISKALLQKMDPGAFLRLFAHTWGINSLK
jgi:hypothetical protein